MSNSTSYIILSQILLAILNRDNKVYLLLVALLWLVVGIIAS